MSNALTTNLDKATRFLERFHNEPLGHFIAGMPVRGGSTETFDNIRIFVGLEELSFPMIAAEPELERCLDDVLRRAGLLEEHAA